MKRSSTWAGLEVRHLLALQAISEEGSFHRAASRLDYTQSGISQQIRALEDIVGERVIDRPGGSRPVRLTAAGEVLLGHADAFLAQVDAARADLRAVSAGSRGTLRVGAFQSIGAHVLPPLTARLAAELPGLEIEWTQTTSDPELYDLLRSGDLDLCFVMLPAPRGPFCLLELMADSFVAMVAADSVLARRRRRLPPRELLELPLVLAKTCRSTDEFLDHAEACGLSSNILLRSDDNGTVQAMVGRGEAVAIVPRLVGEAANGAVALLPIEDAPPPRRIAIAWHESRGSFPFKDGFIDAVTQVCADLDLEPTQRKSKSASS